MSITIRKAKKGDEIGMSKVWRDGFKRKTFIYTGSTRFSNNRMKKLGKTLSSKNPDSIYFVAVDKLKQKIVAHIGYHFKKSGRDRHVIDLGWIVHPDYEGQGIGSKMLKSILEDAKKRGFKRAEAEMAIKNIGSWKIALKNGFKIEGIKKKALLTDDGEYIGTYIVGKIL